MKKIIFTGLMIALSSLAFAQEVNVVKRADKDDIKIPENLVKSFEYLGAACYDKSSDSVAFKTNSYYATMLFQAYLANTKNFNMKSGMLLNWFDLLKSDVFNDRQRAEVLWVLAGANLLNDYSVKTYNLNKAKGMIILDEAFLSDDGLMTEVANLINNINRPPQAEKLTKLDQGRHGSIYALHTGALSNQRNGDYAMKMYSAQSNDDRDRIKEDMYKNKGTAKVAAMAELATIDSIASQIMSNLTSDPRENGLRSQGTYGAVVPIAGFSKYVNTPFRQNMTLVDIAKVNMLQNNMFAGEADAANADTIDVNNMYQYLDVAHVKFSNGKTVPLSKLWKSAWQKVIQKGLKSEDAFSDLDGFDYNSALMDSVKSSVK